MADNEQSLTGEQDKKPKSWADKAAAKTNAKINELNSSGDGSAGNHFFTSREDYLKAKSVELENGGNLPEWQSINLTVLVAEDVQRALNQIKDVADQVIAYAKLGQGAARLLAQVLRGNASIIEGLIDAIRNEIKDILDQMAVAGAGYALYIPPDVANRGGIEYYKRTFYDSLKDKADPRRPVIANTTYAHALFLVAGAPSFARVFQGFEELKKKLMPGGEPNVSSAMSEAMPPPDNFDVKPLYAAAWKMPFTQDTLQRFSDASGIDGMLRVTEDLISATERAQKLQGYCSWDVPSSFEIPAKPNHVVETALDGGVYKVTRHFRNDLGNGSYEYVREDTVITHWLIVRSNNPVDIKNLGPMHAAIKAALQTGESQEGAKHGLDRTTMIFVGRVFPGFDFYSDTGILAIDSAEAEAILNIQGDKKNKIPGLKTKGLAYYYKAAFAGVKKKYHRKFEFVRNVSKSSLLGLTEEISEFKQWKSDDSAKDPTKPYVAASGTVELSNIQSIKASQLLFNGCDPIYDGELVGSTKMIMSDFTPTRAISNETILVPGGGTAPDWYAARLIDFLPPLQNLITRAKNFVDNIADSLIEGLNALLEMVEAVLDRIDQWLNDLIKLMELIKEMLFPPMAGVHYLAISSPRGIDGLKQQLERSFQRSPVSASGEKDYPDEFIKYGSKVSLGEKIIDVGNRSGLKIAADADNRSPSEKEAMDSYKEYEGGEKGRLATLKDLRGRLKGEPSDEELRKLSIPMYDENHITAGMVFIFESNAAMLGFTRLLNLKSFIDAEKDKAKKKLIGVKDFNAAHFPALKYIKPKSRQEKLQERLANLTKTKDRVDDNDAVREVLAAKLEEGLDKEGKPGQVKNDTKIDQDGNKYVIFEGREPYEVSDADAPLVLVLAANGLEFLVVLGAGSYSASALADKINAAYKDSLAKLYGVDIRDLPDLVGTADGKPFFKTPPKVYGDLTGKVRFGGDAKKLDSSLDSGSDILDVGAADLEGGATSDGEVHFPVKNGDLIAELQGFGMPTVEEILATPAIYGYRAFVSDPVVQDFNPARCKLKVKVDDLPQQTVDVTGNLGANPVDATPRITLRKSGLNDFTFPLVLDSSNCQFKLEIDGDYLVVNALTGATATQLENRVQKAGVNWFALGVREGDSITLKKGAATYVDTITRLDGESLYTRFLPTLDGELSQVSVIKANVPSFVDNLSHPKWTATISVASDHIGSDGAYTVATVMEFAQLVQQAVKAAGVDDGALAVTGVDTSSPGDGTAGYLVLELVGEWAIGSSSKLKAYAVSDSGTAPRVLVMPSSRLPLVVTSENESLQVRLLGGSRSGLSVSDEWIKVTLPQGIYTTTAGFANQLEDALHTSGFPEFIQCDVDATGIYVTIAHGTATRHWSYTHHVTIAVKPTSPMEETSLIDTFIDGAGSPPVLDLDVSSLSFPVKISENYASKFKIKLDPVVSSRPAGAHEITVPSGTYADISALATAVEAGLTLNGYPSGTTGFIRVKGVTTLGGKYLRFYLRPEAIYLTDDSLIEVTNARVGTAVRTAPSIVWDELRDYSYERVFAWMTANSNTPSPIGFPDPAPLFNFNSSSSMYVGYWVVTTSNNKFEIQLDTPFDDVPSDWQTVTIPNGNYSSLAVLVTQIQLGLNNIYGSGTLTVTASGNSIAIETSSSRLVGAYTTIRTRQYQDQAFFCYGARTSGALYRDVSGAGDMRLLEAAGAADDVAYGRKQLMFESGLLGPDVDPVDGLPWLTSSGVDTHDLFDYLGVASPQIGFGSKKVPYTLSQVISAINAHFSAISKRFKNIASDPLLDGHLTLTSVNKGAEGRLSIVAADDGTPAGRESAEVYALVFGNPDRRETDVNVRGLGRAPRSAALEVELIPEDELMVEIVADKLELELVPASYEAEVVETNTGDTKGYLVEVESL